MNTNSYILNVESDPEDPENLMLTFPDDLLEKMDWKIGDTLVWDVQDDGTITLKKKTDDIQQS